MIIHDIETAARLIKEDQVVAIPTETVYGLAANAFSELAVRKIFELKNRPLYNPLIVHVGTMNALEQVSASIPAAAMLLAKRYWPGPLTLLLNKTDRVPDLVTAGKKTVAVRIPIHPVALRLLEQLNVPLAAPSANPFGSISPTTAEHVETYFGDAIPAVLEGGRCERGVESTIVGFESGVPVLYRPGAISLEELRSVFPAIMVKTSAGDQPVAPGMLDRHYSPRTPVVFMDEAGRNPVEKPAMKAGRLVFRNEDLVGHPFTEVLSPSGDLKEAARNLYAALHRLDSLGLECIFVERMPEVGLGRTINDRLKRAATR